MINEDKEKKYYGNVGLNTCMLTVRVDDKQIYSNKFFNKDYKKISNKNNLLDEFLININANAFNSSDKHQIEAEITGENSIKRNWDIDGFILIPDNCDGQIKIFIINISVHCYFYKNFLELKIFILYKVLLNIFFGKY